MVGPSIGFLHIMRYESQGFLPPEAISYMQVGDSLFGRALQILREHYGPGGDTGRVPLVHDGEEGGIVISGRLEVTVDGERRILGPGDAYYFESRRPHRFRSGPRPRCLRMSAPTR